MSSKKECTYEKCETGLLNCLQCAELWGGNVKNCTKMTDKEYEEYMRRMEKWTLYKIDKDFNS